MTAVYIILGILLFFFLLSLLRIGVRADFAGDLADTSVTVIAGPARIQMLPKPDKPEKPKKPKKEKKKKTPQEESTKGKEKKKLSLSAQDIKTLLPAVWASLKGGLRKTRQRLLIDRWSCRRCCRGRWTRRGRRSCTAISTPECGR